MKFRLVHNLTSKLYLGMPRDSDKLKVIKWNVKALKGSIEENDLAHD